MKRRLLITFAFLTAICSAQVSVTPQAETLLGSSLNANITSANGLTTVSGGTIATLTATQTVTNKDLTSTTNTFPIAGYHPIYSGQWETVLFINNPNQGTGYNAKIFAVALPITKTHTVTDIGIEVTTGVALSTIRLALYTDSVGIPGHLIEQSGDISSATTGLKSYTFSTPWTLTAANQQYWICLQSTSSLLTFTQTANTLSGTFLTGTGTHTTNGSAVFTYGAYPSHFTLDTWNGINPLISLKVQ